MQLTIEIQDLDQWRRAGRPPNRIPDDLLAALRYTLEHAKMACLPRDDPNDPIGAAELRELRNLLRSACTQLGGRLRFQADRYQVRFRMVDPPADAPAQREAS